MNVTITVQPIGGALRIPIKDKSSTLGSLKETIIKRAKKLAQFKALGLSKADAGAVECEGIYDGAARLDSDDEADLLLSAESGLSVVLEGKGIVKGSAAAADPGAGPGILPPQVPGSGRHTRSGPAPTPAPAPAAATLVPIHDQSAPVPPVDVDPSTLREVDGYSSGPHTVAYRMLPSVRFVRLAVDPKNTTLGGLRRAIARVESLKVFDPKSGKAYSGKKPAGKKSKSKPESKPTGSDPTSGSGADDKTVTMHLATRPFPLDPPATVSGSGRGGGGLDEDPGALASDADAKVSDDLTLEEWGFTGSLSDPEPARSIHGRAEVLGGAAGSAAAASAAGPPQSTTIFVTLCNRDSDPMAAADEGADGSAVTQSDTLRQAAEWQPVIGGANNVAIAALPENDLRLDPSELVGAGGGAAGGSSDPVQAAAMSGAGGDLGSVIQAPAASARRQHTRASMLREQSEEGMSEFLACLLVMERRLDTHQKTRLLGILRRVTQFAPVPHYMSVLMRRLALPRAGKAAISAAIYQIGRAMLPASVPDGTVFEHSRSIFSFLLLKADGGVKVVKPDTKVEDIEELDSLTLARYPEACTDSSETFNAKELHCEITHERLEDPVRVVEVPADASGAAAKKAKLDAATLAHHKDKVYTRAAALSKISKKNGGTKPDAEAMEAHWGEVTAAHLETDAHTMCKMRSCPQTLTACEWQPQSLHAVDSAHAAAAGLGTDDTVVARGAAASGAGADEDNPLAMRSRPLASCSANGPAPQIVQVGRPAVRTELRARLRQASVADRAKIPGLQRCHPSSLNEAHVYTLTVNGKGRTVVYTERSKTPGKSTRLFDPLSGEWTDVDKDALADELRTNNVELDDAGGDMTPREPEEAVVLCVDTSKSMWSYGFEDPQKISDDDFMAALRSVYDKAVARQDATGAAARRIAKEKLLDLGFTDPQIKIDPSEGEKFVGRLRARKEIHLLRRLWNKKISTRGNTDKFRYIVRELAFVLMTQQEHGQGFKRRKSREARIVCATYAAKIIDCLQEGARGGGGGAAGGGGAGGAAAATAGVPSEHRWQLVDPAIIGRGCPDSVRCPLSHKLMIDPVRANNGKVYERKAIVAHLKSNGRLPGENSPAATAAQRTLKADAEKLRAVRRWLEGHSSGTSDNAYGGRGFWFASRYRRNFGTDAFSHGKWTNVFAHSFSTRMGLYLTLWEQAGFSEEMAPSKNTPWHNVKTTDDSFISGQAELPSNGNPLINEDKIGLAYTKSPDGVAWPPPIEDEELDSDDFDQPTLGSSALIEERIGSGLAVPTGSMYMREQYDDQGSDPERKSRMLTVKVLFQAFVDRTAAFDLPHSLGLVSFSTTFEEKCALTPSFETLRGSLEDMEEKGSTAMHDAIKHAAGMLTSWKASVVARRRDQGIDMPPPRLRIVCLSDGQDTSSQTPLHRVAKTLMDQGITLDGVLVGTSTNEPLHQVAKCTGGYSFHPDTMFDGLQLCELETFLSSADRPVAPARDGDVSSSGDLRKWSSYRVSRDVCSDTRVPQRRQDPRQRRKALPLAKAVEVASAAAGAPVGAAPPAAPGVARSGGSGRGAGKGTGGADSAALVQRNRRLMREMHALMKRPHSACRVYPNQEDISYWRVVMQGAENTPYEGGIWCLQVAFPPEYPVKPPSVRFLTPIRHVNVSIQGRVCHAILDRAWSPEQTMRDVVSQVYGLMMTPEKDDPLDSNLAAMLNTSDGRGKYEATVQAFVERHAKGKSMEEWERELLGR